MTAETRRSPGAGGDEDDGAERRQITTMFCDIAGSSDIAGRLDPEDLRDLLRSYQALCAEAVERHGGLVGQFLGDGIVAYFGHPGAREDAAEQAIRAAHAIVAAVGALNAAGKPIAVRMGIATGLAVVGDRIGNGASTQIAVTGQVPILASRVQSLVPPGAIGVANETRHLVRLRFDWHDFGFHPVKGFPEPIRIWIAGEERSGPLARAPSVVDVPMLGRQRELGVLLDRWQRTCAGAGGVLLLSGDPGVGKSTIVEGAISEIERGPGQVALLQCAPRHADTPLHPVRSFLRRSLRWSDAVDTSQRRSRVEAFLQPLGLSGALGDMLDILAAPDPQSGPIAPGVAAGAKQRDFNLLLDIVERSAARTPLLLIFEDAHWADATTNALIAALVRASSGRRLLILAAARPEIDAEWTRDPAVTLLRLSRLGSRDAQRLVEQIAKGRLRPSVIKTILSRSDGVPLFLGEITRSALEAMQAGRSVASDEIPMTLNDGLAMRLDRLGSAKITAQVAAVLGRVFDLEILANVLEQSKAETLTQIAALRHAGLVRPTRLGTERRFIFGHHLLQEAAYANLLRSKRRKLHARCATAYEARESEIVSLAPELLAHHWDMAEEPKRAAPYWLAAAQRAQARAANVEAAVHFERCLAALSKMRSTSVRDRLALEAELGLGQAHYVLDGPAHAATTEAYARAQAIAERVADPGQRSRALYGIFSGYHFASHFALAETPARLLLRIAERDGRDEDYCQAHRMLAYLAFFRGRLQDSITHSEELVSHYHADKQQLLAYQFGADCLVGVRGFQAVIESMSGPYEVALARADANLGFAMALKHPASIGWAYAAGSYVRYFGGDRVSAREHSARGVNYCARHGVAAWQVHCKLFELWGRNWPSRPQQSTVRSISSVMKVAAQGNQLGLALFRLVTAELLLDRCESGAALEEVEKAIEDIDLSGQLVFLPVATLLKARCKVAIASEGDDHLHLFRLAAQQARTAGATVIEYRALGHLSRHSAPLHGDSD